MNKDTIKKIGSWLKLTAQFFSFVSIVMSVVIKGRLLIGLKGENDES